MAEELRDIEPLRPLLEHRPLALLSDIDGTLAPIVPHPDDAHVTTRARAAILALIEGGVRVAFVTGRPLDTARRMVDIPEAYYAANHGLDVWADGREETPEEVRPYVGWAREVLREIEPIDVSGVVVEDKGAILAFHYRRADVEVDALAAIRSAIASSETARHFQVQEGRKVYELRPPMEINKGTAARSLAERMGAKAVLAMGDDVTDLQMFEAVRAMQAPSVVIGVWNEESPEVVESADYFVRGVPGVEWLLEKLVRVTGDG
jgi:trehalose 6-phosphate phosphatase